jgi:hypothetical protein
LTHSHFCGCRAGRARACWREGSSPSSRTSSPRLGEGPAFEESRVSLFDDRSCTRSLEPVARWWRRPRSAKPWHMSKSIPPTLPPDDRHRTPTNIACRRPGIRSVSPASSRPSISRSRSGHGMPRWHWPAITASSGNRRRRRLSPRWGRKRCCP